MNEETRQYLMRIGDPKLDQRERKWGELVDEVAMWKHRCRELEARAEAAEARNARDLHMLKWARDVFAEKQRYADQGEGGHWSKLREAAIAAIKAAEAPGDDRSD
jgi:hypothetical protein